MAEATFEGWAILELMGHRKLGGMLSESVIGGASFIRIDIPTDPPATQFYAPASVYCITPTTEAIAKACAEANRPAPVQRWELPALKSPKPNGGICRTCGDSGIPISTEGYCEDCTESLAMNLDYQATTTHGEQR